MFQDAGPFDRTSSTLHQSLIWSGDGRTFTGVPSKSAVSKFARNTAGPEASGFGLLAFGNGGYLVNGELEEQGRIGGNSLGFLAAEPELGRDP